MNEQDPKMPPVMYIHNMNFQDQTIVLDYHEYKNCKFSKCDMVFYGHGPIGMIGCKFIDCNWVFSGPAEATLKFMATLYKNGHGAEKIIEETFNRIIKGTYL